MTGRDNGLDCTVELVENEEWTNKKIEGQIKGTRSPTTTKKRSTHLRLRWKLRQYDMVWAARVHLSYSM